LLADLVEHLDLTGMLDCGLSATANRLMTLIQIIRSCAVFDAHVRSASDLLVERLAGSLNVERRGEDSMAYYG